MRWKIITIAILFPLALALISWEQGQYPKYCEEVENCTEHNLLVYAWLLFSDFFEKFESLFVVVFTACIAWFTLELRRSTDRLWLAGEKQIRAAKTAATWQRMDTHNSLAISQSAAKAAKKSADALVATERARFYIVVGRVTLQDFTEFFASGRPDDFGSYSGDWLVPYTLKNYGKTPAIIRETSHFLINAVKPPDEPTYIPVDIVEGEFAISADKSTNERYCRLAPEFKIGQQEAQALLRGHTTLWFYGRVLYDDVLGGQQHEHCWLWRYNGTSKGFRPCYDYPNYIKNT